MRAIEPVYRSEGTPSIPGGAGIVVDAPHPNAARLFISWLLSREGQQLPIVLASLPFTHLAPP